MAAALFYEAKVTEAIALVVDAWKRQGRLQARPLSAEDVESLQNVVSYEVIIFCTADSAVKELAQA